MTNEIAIAGGSSEAAGHSRGGAYDLAERTARFGEAVIALAKHVPQNAITRPLISQVVRCGTSVESNYCEADEADTNKEFRYRI